MSLAAALAAAALLTIAPVARADGDPASDYLIGQQIFFPFSAKFQRDRQAQFAQLVREANQGGFKIRVALIGSSYDMGSIPSLYLKPRNYARFLGQELSFVYKQRLLVVMRNGVGFNWPGHSSAPAYATLGTIRIGPGTDGLLTAAETAVRRLAAADGLKLATPAAVRAPSRSDSHDRVIIIAAVAAAIVLALAARLALGRLRRPQA